MYFPDLSPYSYLSSKETSTKNIGWLNPKHAFTQGPVPALFIEKLWVYCANYRFQQTRGWQQCLFCEDKPIIQVDPADPNSCLGSAEIRVITHDQRIYAAPNLIYHYVVTHQYCPPDECIEAVLDGIDPHSEAYQRQLKAIEQANTKQRLGALAWFFHRLING